jgi:hypothetical protein
MTVRSISSVFCLLLATSLLGGCGDDPPADTGGGGKASATRSFLTEEDPADAVSVFDAKEKEAGTEVAVYGRVREVTHGFAAFTMIDEEIEYCGQADPEDDHCPTPWDYCCIAKDTQVAASLPVEFRDAKGEPVEAEQPDLKRLDLVAIRGRLEKTDSGGLVLVTTTGWYRRERPKLGDHVTEEP